MKALVGAFNKEQCPSRWKLQRWFVCSSNYNKFNWVSGLRNTTSLYTSRMSLKPFQLRSKKNSGISPSINLSQSFSFSLRDLHRTWGKGMILKYVKVVKLCFKSHFHTQSFIFQHFYILIFFNYKKVKTTLFHNDDCQCGYFY